MKVVHGRGRSFSAFSVARGHAQSLRHARGTAVVPLLRGNPAPLGALQLEPRRPEGAVEHQRVKRDVQVAHGPGSGDNESLFIGEEVQDAPDADSEIRHDGHRREPEVVLDATVVLPHLGFPIVGWESGEGGRVVGVGWGWMGGVYGTCKKRGYLCIYYLQL